ncbi:HAD family phosphatase [Pengzhenrongella frigida]|uniref:HAD family phosphatase n=1 Tax=Pengzhenrongella frigida TaxID=1259133 RepID=A0A4Q5N421_9MICO|nr:HAD family phosphatase [Cellulomonas sp. HLT2-17]
MDTVVFDLGNVLVRWDPYGPFVGRLDHRAVARFFADVDFPAFNQRQDSGRSWAHARADVHARFPEHARAVDLYVEHFVDAVPGPVEGSAQIVRDLASDGVRLFGLTNWSAETYHHAEPAAPVIGLLEGVLVSGQVGLVKPDPRIFALLAERFDLVPGRTVFIDDSPANVEAAVRVGYQAVLFTSADALRRDLRALGLAVGAAAPRT